MLELSFLSRSRIRLVRQTEVAECGLASLAMVASYHGFDIDLGTMRRQFAPSLRGAPLRSLMDVADRIGFVPRPVTLPLEELRNLAVPCILHWDMSHYVVLEKVVGDRALIHNPDGRSRFMKLSEVSDHFTGVALELRPGNDFKIESKRERLKLSQIWRNTTGLKRAILQIILLTLVLQAFVLFSPYYMQVAIDNVLPALDLDLLVVLAIGFCLFTIINAAADLLRSYVILATGTTLGFSLASDIARRLFRLPVDWFDKRHTGDVLSRFQSVAPVQSMLSQGAVAALVDGGMTILTLVLMFWYSPVLAMIAIVAFCLYAIVRAISFSLERDAQENAIILKGKEQSTLIETLHGITTLRLFGREGARHTHWQSKLSNAVNADVRLTQIGIWQRISNSLIFGLENILTIYLAIKFIVTGAGFSVGMVFAFMAYKSQFLSKSAALIDNVIAFRMLGLHLERLSDIALSAEDKSFGEAMHHDYKLTGRLELKNVCFRYSASDPLVLEGLDLTVEPGEFAAITGPSGQGKSTLVKLLLGLVEPESGSFLVDGLPLEKFGYKNYQGQIAAVLQNDTLFAGSLAENIALFDDDLDIERVHQASQRAAIHSDIMNMPMGYNTLVGDMGSTLSGGQKQRVLLARALYREPRVLIMDEGTSHLDAELEKAVNGSLSEMQITRIIIAHREETLKSAERVLVLQDRKIALA